MNKKSGLRKLFGMTWTCWRGGQIPCKKCGACRSRTQGFLKAGLTDPFDVRT